MRDKIILAIYFAEAIICTDTCVSLASVLVFATGSSEIPPLGFFPKPKIHFWEDVWPRSNTCGNILLENNDLDYDTFKMLMDDAILNSPTFGMA
jgi:hypothetical protein